MSTYTYIPIDKDQIPYRFNMVIANKTYTFVIHYNAAYDFFSIDLLRNGEVVVLGEKVVYGNVLFSRQTYADTPDIPIIPYDLSQNETRVTWDNLNETVFLWLMDDA